jgi:deoxyribonuclease V
MREKAAYRADMRLFPFSFPFFLLPLIQNQSTLGYNRHMDWNVTPREAIALQKELCNQVRIEPLERTIGKRLEDIRHIGGCDVSMSMFAKHGFAGFVTLSYPDLALIGESVVAAPIGFPYIPGLLSFREIPMLLEAWEALDKLEEKDSAEISNPKPEVLIVDGTGIAHPRRLGIASHLGILLNVPTIGCAKSLLTGIHEMPGDRPGDFSYIYDRKSSQEPGKKESGEIIGAVLRSKPGVKPLYISPGHMITLEESIAIVRSCLRRHRLPEPTRIAHNTMNEYRRRSEKADSGL